MPDTNFLDENDSVKRIRHAGIFQRRQELRLHQNAIGLSYRKYFTYRENFIEKELLTGLCFSYQYIRGRYLTWGVQFDIRIFGYSGKPIRIHFKSFLNRQKNELLQQYYDLIDLIWETYFDPLVTRYLQDIDQGKVVEIGPVKINRNYITIKKTGLVGSSEKTIPTNQLALSEYRTYCTVYDKQDAAKTNASFSYHSDPWAIVILWVVKSIIHPAEEAGSR